MQTVIKLTPPPYTDPNALILETLGIPVLVRVKHATQWEIALEGAPVLNDAQKIQLAQAISDEWGLAASFKDKDFVP